MISIDRALLRQLLMIERPWEVREYHLDLRKRRLDIWIGEEVERGWFGREKKPARPSSEHHWQHISFGPLKLQLHVSVPNGMDIRNLAWTGDIGMPFTRALANRVFTLFNEGLSLAVVCKLLELTLQDVWRYRYALDNGRTTVSAAEAEAAAPREMQTQAPAAVGKPAANAAGSAGAAGSDVPDVTNPVWQRLLEGDVSLDIKVLSLKLMLTRVRSQMELITDDEVRMLKMRDLHRYFVKNQRVLGHELSQIRAAA